MKRFLKYAVYYSVILLFIIFNLVLFDSLRYKKPDQEELKPKMVIVSHVYGNPYWTQVRLGAEKAAMERGVVIDFQGPDDASVEESIRLIKMAYAAKASGIITYVQDESYYKDIINKIIEDGIPLVTIDSDAENSKRLAYVGTDNVEAGRVGGREMIRQIGTEGKVAIIMGGKDVKNQIERVEGFKGYLKSNSNIDILAIETSDSYLLEAELAAKKILSQHPDIKGLFCTSALDGIGASRAVKDLGVAGKVKIVCFDDLPETLDSIEDGVITSTVVQQPYVMGYKAVNIIVDNIEGKKTKGLFITDVQVVDKENLDEFREKQKKYSAQD